MNDKYVMPKGTTIGHVHLKVSNLQQSLDFYCGLLGYEVMMTYGDQAAFIAAGDYHHHIGLNVWHSKNAPPADKNSVGLFHTAIVYPTRKDLAEIFKRLKEKGYPLTGAADHGVSEALYLDDPDENGVELYWDRPREEWPKNDDGSIHMYTKPLDLDTLLEEL
ncbi:VOC family protein [Flavobacteriaceae bacterium TK19130]|nr:VOC family protein [Thermobacterium salinum]